MVVNPFITKDQSTARLSESGDPHPVCDHVINRFPRRSFATLREMISGAVHIKPPHDRRLIARVDAYRRTSSAANSRMPDCVHSATASLGGHARPPYGFRSA